MLVTVATTGFCSSAALSEPSQELIDAAKGGGMLKSIALPHGWCGYGDVIEGLNEKNGLEVNELNPNAGSGCQPASQRGSVAHLVQLIHQGATFWQSSKEVADDVMVVATRFSARALTDRFTDMVRNARQDALAAWLDEADGSMIALRRAMLGYVSQFLRVVPHVPTLSAVSEPLLVLGVPAAEAEARVAEWLTRLKIGENLWSLSPTTFPGGEQQRVNIARGVVHSYPVLLLDEPTASPEGRIRQTGCRDQDHHRGPKPDPRRQPFRQCRGRGIGTGRAADCGCAGDLGCDQSPACDLAGGVRGRPVVHSSCPSRRSEHCASPSTGWIRVRPVFSRAA